MLNQYFQEGAVRLGAVFSIIFAISLGCFCARIFGALIPKLIASQRRSAMPRPPGKARQLSKLSSNSTVKSPLLKKDGETPKLSGLEEAGFSQLKDRSDRVGTLPETISRGRGNSLPPEVINFTLAVLLPALGYYGLVVGLIPFLSMNYEVYVSGYWKPRLIAPALLAFAIVGFWGLFRLSSYFRITNLVQALICAQIILDISLFVF